MSRSRAIVAGALLLGLLILVARQLLDSKRRLETSEPARTAASERSGEVSEFTPASLPATQGTEAAVPVAIRVPEPPATGNRWVHGDVCGRIVDAAGRPVAGAQLRLRPASAVKLPGVRASETARAEPHSTEPATASDAEGRFTLAFDHFYVCELDAGPNGLPWSESWDPGLRIEAAGHGLRVDSLQGWEGGHRDLGDLYLPAACALHGHVVDEDGHAVAAVRVRADMPYELRPKPSGSDPTLDLSATRSELVATSAADGQFELATAWAGTRWLFARGPRGEEGQLTLDAGPAATSRDVGELVVGPSAPVPASLQQMFAQLQDSGPTLDSSSSDGAVVSGRVLDADGRALPDTWLDVFLPGPADAPRRRAVRSDEQGAFVLRDGPAGHWRFVSQPAIEAELDVAAGESKSIELRAHRLGVLRGTVLAFGQPLEGAEVYPFLPSQGGGDWTELTTGPDGRYEFETDHGPDTYEICVQSPSGRRTGFEEFERAVDWDQVIDMDIDLGSAGVRGRLVSASDGRPLAGVRVSLCVAGGKDAAGSGTTDADGRFLVGPVAPAAYSLVASDAHGRAEQPVDLSDGQLKDGINLALPEDLASLRVELAGRLGRTCRNYMLLLEAEGRPAIRHDLVSLPFVLEGLAPGDWSLVLEHNAADPFEDDAAAVRTALQALHLQAGQAAVYRIDAALLRTP